ncbi:hypothetical protein QBC38DRAFT_24308 [Podospora fimiseda]|uniref:Apple domain-containing protein n=1 Tax=Podospora fimiseda TaxID=252190 RepID=A0AAN7BJA9_9PEZI|nr:hypothetical protein QBC38DRAFT_24308 [Podospora fimiseda]
MRSISALVLGAGFLSSVANGAFLEVCTVNAVLEYFTCQHVSEDCFEPVLQQAEDWCRDYLSIEPVTVHASTVIPEAEVVTVVETTTVTDRTVDFITATEETTITATSTSIVQQTVTVTTTTTSTAAMVKREDVPTTTAQAPAPVTTCVDLTKKNLLRHPAARLSKACSCLNPEPATVTLPATTLSAAGETITVTVPATESEMATDTAVTTVISSTVVTDVVTVTSTVTATETSTVVYDRCSTTYNGGGNGVGNHVVNVQGVTSKRDCCERCMATPNCVASASTGPGSCQHLVKITQLAGAPTNNQCPLGIENYPGIMGVNPNGALMKGPCQP